MMVMNDLVYFSIRKKKHLLNALLLRMSAEIISIILEFNSEYKTKTNELVDTLLFFSFAVV